MNNEQSIFDLIENYHLGLLSKEEAEKVESRIKTDAAFAEYVKFNGFASEIVHSSGLDLLRAQMTSDLTKIERNRTTKKWIIGAGVIATMIGLTLLWFAGKSNETKKVIPNTKNIKNGATLQENSNQKTLNPERDYSSKTKEILASNSSQYYTENETRIPSHPSSSYLPIQNSIDSSQKTESVNEYKEKNTNPENTKAPCAISFNAIVQLTCKGEQTGAILVEQQTISGGTAPYTFQSSHETQKSSTGSFSELAKGNYTITLTDSRTCSTKKEFTVYEKNCASKKSFSFNPDYGEKWEMQLNEEKSGSFTIYNRAGIIFRSTSFSQDHTIEWDGTNMHGALADMGMYICAINYTDGKTELIELSIVR